MASLTSRRISCTKCNSLFSEGEMKVNRRYLCRKCSALREKAYYDRDKDNPEAMRKRKEKYWANREMNMHVTRESQWKRMYNIDSSKFTELMESQEDSCLICLKLLNYSSKARTPHIDHNHKTGQVRGMLCGSCNLAIGFMRDNVTIAKSVTRFLENN